MGRGRGERREGRGCKEGLRRSDTAIRGSPQTADRISIKAMQAGRYFLRWTGEQAGGLGASAMRVPMAGKLPAAEKPWLSLVARISA